MSDTQKEVPTAQNTDRDLWQEHPGDYYGNRIFLTEGGGIGLCVGGYCIVQSIAKWHALADREIKREEKRKRVE